MDRVRLENMPAGIVILNSSQVPINELDTINRMRKYTVSAPSGPIRPSCVLA